MTIDPFEERLKGLSEEELKGMLATGLKEYTVEALAAARAELARRGKTGAEVKPAAPAVPGIAIPSSAGASATKPSRWGAALVGIGAFFIYATTLFGVLAAVRSDLHLKVGTEQIFQVLIFAGVAFICLRAGSRRRAGWQTLLGACLLIFAGLAFFSLKSLAAQRPGTLMPKVVTPTVVILAVLGVLALAAGFIKKSCASK